jgi:hypothetical protein
MRSFEKLLLLERKTTSVEGRHCIFSKYLVSETTLETTSATNSSSSRGCGDKEVKETVD